MFNRDNFSANPFGGRSDSNRQQRQPPPQNFSRPQQQQPPPPAGYGGDTRMGGYTSPPPSQQPPQRTQVGRPPPQDAQYSQYQQSPRSAGLGSIMELSPVKNPGANQWAFADIVAVSSVDFPDRQDTYLLVNGQFVMTARPHDKCMPGQIGLSDYQRTWAGISLGPGEIVQAQRYEPFSKGKQVYLGAVDAEIGFATKKSSDMEFDQDELAKHVIRSYDNHFFAPGQLLLMDYKSVPLRIVIKTIQLMDLSMEKGTPSSSDPQSRGILTSNAHFNFSKDARSDIKLLASLNRPSTNPIIRSDFKFEDMGIGGLDSEFSTIFRRAFASRLFPPGIADRMGIQHVRGMLLYGPPGTGKTLIARKIGEMLNARPPKIINGPEVLNKFVGQSEENIRKIFADAEKEWKEKGEESALHIIIFDELDAVCKSRGSGAGGGTGVGDNVVNQLLTKLDGVETAGNFLMIGMTNRMDMIDEALLRPGRLELHLEISLPDEQGRVQILNIHTVKLRKNGHLADDVNLPHLARKTKNYSGAELSGLIRAATSFAFTRQLQVMGQGSVKTLGDVREITVNGEDFDNALLETKPMFGIAEEELERCLDRGIVHYSDTVGQILEAGEKIVQSVREDASLVTALLWGPGGSGKTALAAKIALESEFPFIKFITPKNMVGFTDMAKIQNMEKTFRDADKSPTSIIILDDVEHLMEYVAIGPRFSLTVLGALRSLLTKEPPKGRRRLVLATTSMRGALSQVNLLGVFQRQIHVPNVNSVQDIAYVLDSVPQWPQDATQRALYLYQQSASGSQMSFGVKQIIATAVIAKRAQDPAEACAEIFEELRFDASMQPDQNAPPQQETVMARARITGRQGGGGPDSVMGRQEEENLFT